MAAHEQEQEKQQDDDASAQRSPLPHKVVMEILAYLPAKSAGRFRCVLRSWQATLSSPRFFELHLRRANHTPPPPDGQSSSSVLRTPTSFTPGSLAARRRSWCVTTCCAPPSSPSRYRPLAHLGKNNCKASWNKEKILLFFGINPRTSTLLRSKGCNQQSCR